jgi:hypothetical protein
MRADSHLSLLSARVRCSGRLPRAATGSACDARRCGLTLRLPASSVVIRPIPPGINHDVMYASYDSFCGFVEAERGALLAVLRQRRQRCYEADSLPQTGFALFRRRTLAGSSIRCSTRFCEPSATGRRLARSRHCTSSETERREQGLSRFRQQADDIAAAHRRQGAVEGNNPA